MNLNCPVCNKDNIVLVKEIFSDSIIRGYRENYQIDVGKFFINTIKVFLYKCKNCNYLFYYPFNLQGDDDLYERLERFSWYYMDWKWEHKIASSFIKSGDKVLEIGCGNGGFIRNMKAKNIEVIGLELNKKSSVCSQNKGLNIINDSIEKFSLNNKENFDIVCSFQVLEHIYDVKSFIFSSLRVLKTGGRMIISTPNYMPSSPIFEDNLLNMPPHHMGIWDINCFIHLEKIFNISLKKIELEPLQPYHFDIFYSYLRNNSVKKYGFTGKILSRMIKPLTSSIIKNLSNFIIGHTIIVQYEKL